MEICYKPRGVCSRQMKITVEDGIIEHIEITGGCSGNLQGLCKLVQGRAASEVIGLLKGIECGGKPTSCPDQLAIALEQAISQ